VACNRDAVKAPGLAKRDRSQPPPALKCTIVSSAVVAVISVIYRTLRLEIRTSPDSVSFASCHY
jgi:hypothetical protein